MFWPSTKLFLHSERGVSRSSSVEVLQLHEHLEILNNTILDTRLN